MTTDSRDWLLLSAVCSLLPIAGICAQAMPTVALVKDINPGAAGCYLNGLVNVGGDVYFLAADAAHGLEVWRTDGTSAGTSLVVDLYPGPNSGANAVGRIGDKILVMGGYGPSNTPYSIYLSDGTAAGTVVLRSGLSHIGAGFSEAIDGVVYFGAGTPSTGLELWRTDGTTAGTYFVKETHPGPITGGAYGMTELPNRPGYFVFSGSISSSLWLSNGTASGTIQLVSGLGPYQFTRFKNELLFFGFTLANGRELWKTDGTLAGTVQVAEIRPGSGYGAGFSNGLVVMGDKVYFAGNDGVTGTELWESDGTAAGTHLVKDIYPGGAASLPSQMVGFGSRKFYFSAWDGVVGRELWESDGTPAGTQLVADINPGPGDGISQDGAYVEPRNDILRVDNRLLFMGRQPASGPELWSLTDPQRAVAVSVGTGCGIAGEIPSCRATDPVLAGTSLVTCGDVPNGYFAYLLIGYAVPYPVSLVGGCEAHLDLSRPIPMVDAWLQAGTGDHVTSLAMPSSPVLVGSKLAMQVVSHAPQAAQLSLSEGVNLILGY